MESEIRERLQKRRVNFDPWQWEGRCKWLYDSISSYDDLKKHILGDDVNEKIFAIRNISPLIYDLISEEERKKLLSVLRTQLSDERLCQIVYGGLYADDEDTTTISQAAENSIRELERFLQQR